MRAEDGGEDAVAEQEEDEETRARRSLCRKTSGVGFVFVRCGVAAEQAQPGWP